MAGNGRPAEPDIPPGRDADLSEANRRLRESARRNEEILSGVARELREPIGEARAELRRLLSGGGSLADEQRAALERVDRHVARLAELQQDLVDLHDLVSGRAELRRDPTDLAEVAARVAEAAEPLARTRGVAVERAIAAFPVSVLGDRERLRHAFEELAAHVLAAAPGGSTLVFRLEALPGGGRFVVEVRAQPGERAAALEVATAVALALCREVVELHGGVLGVAPGRAEVWITEEVGVQPPAPGAATIASEGTRPRILVVEDDEPTREALAEALGDTYDVEPASDGVEGVEAARARHPDVILMDLYLPRLDGFGALDALRSDPATADVPVILVSGRGDDLTRARSLDLGAIDFLQKPYSERELRARIERTLRLSRRASELQALAETDALTGLANRRAFLTRLAQEVKRARRYGTPLACVMVDMDRLKPVNDQFGHAAGDRAIATLAKVLQSELRETDFGARYGGDEFVVLLPHTAAPEGRALAERVCERLRETTFDVDGATLPLHASFGVAELPGGSPDEAADAVVRHADAALYTAKGAGRSRVAVYEETAPAPEPDEP
jgi:diguanylate cyclase (GGDEF)-like protein